MSRTMFSLTGKSAVITGAGSGIGEAVARRFREAGAEVLLVDRRDASMLADSLGGAFFQADVSVVSELEAAMRASKERFGKLDILVSNAGIQPLGVGFADLTEALFDRTMAVNVRSVAFGIRLAGKLLSDGGRVLNTGSFVGLLGTPGSAAYATSKAAVTHLTRLGAIELAPRRITVNAICPGTVRTPAVTDLPDNPEIPFIERKTPLGRLAEPSEVAAMFHYLASDEAAYVTGQSLAIDGGITAGWNEYDLIAPPNVVDGAWTEDPAEEIR